MTQMQRLLAAAAVAMLAACSQKPATTAAKAGESVATVDGKSISRDTYNQFVKGVAGKPAEDLTAEQRKQLLDNLVRAEVVAADAERTGIAAKDETRFALEMAR